MARKKTDPAAATPPAPSSKAAPTNPLEAAIMALELSTPEAEMLAEWALGQLLQEEPERVHAMADELRRLPSSKPGKKNGAGALPVYSFAAELKDVEGLDPEHYRVAVVVDRVDGEALSKTDMKTIETAMAEPAQPPAPKPRAAPAGRAARAPAAAAKRAAPPKRAAPARRAPSAAKRAPAAVKARPASPAKGSPVRAPRRAR